MIGLLAATPLILMAPVELRGGRLVDAPVERVSLQGVEVGGDEPRIIGWDNVKRVIGDAEADAAPFMDMAERAWRARIRIARGDFGMASSLLEALFTRLRDESGPTPLMVAEGTLACRLFFGDRVGAVEAWLEAVRLRAEGWRIAGDPPLDPIVDPDTLLMPSLAPVWLGREELIALVEGMGGPEPAIDSTEPQRDADIAARLRTLYVASARRALGFEVDEARVAHAGQSPHEGVQLVAAMVQAESGDPAIREAARGRLRDAIDTDLGTWREAWRRIALGRSLLMEPDEGRRLDGLFELVHLPARFSRSQGYLCGVALAIMSDEARARGDTPAAERLRRELEERHPNHPALRWLGDQTHASDPSPSETETEDASEATESPESEPIE